MITITPYTEEHKLQWDTYVEAHSRSTLFHLTSWKKVVEQSFGHKAYYLMAIGENPQLESCKRYPASNIQHPASSNQTVVGILPLFRIKSFLFGHYLVSVPFAELGGVLADDQKVEKRLLEKAIEIAQEIQCDYLELRNKKEISNLYTKSLYFNFKREIFQDLDENLKAIPRKARRMVRQGIKFGCISETGHQCFHDFYDIMALNYHKLGTPIFPRKFFKTFLQVFGNNAQILLIRNKDKIPIAAVLFFFFKDQVIPYYAGSDFEYRRLAPNDFMYWELMRHACEKEYKWFDFGRSKIDTGSYHFKRHWGFEPVPLAYQYHLVKAKELPNLSPANPKYKKKIELWRKLPLSLTKLLGPPIARYLA